MKKVCASVVVVLAMEMARASVVDYYFYPSGPKPPGIPPDSMSSHSVALAAWGDAAVDANRAAHAFGSDEWAHAECGFLSRLDAQILFKFSDAYEALTGQVDSAALHLYLIGARAAGSEVTLDVGRLTNAWAEGTVSWNTRPPRGPASPAYSGTPGMNGMITVDVTAPVEAEQLEDAGLRHGIAVGDCIGTSPYMETKESPTAAFRPFLHIAVVPESNLAAGLLAALVFRFARQSFYHTSSNRKQRQ